MTDIVIKVENLSKQYRIGEKEGYKTFRETLVDAIKAPLRGVKQLINPQSETIWASKMFPSKSSASKALVLSVEKALIKAHLLKSYQKLPNLWKEELN